MPITLPGSMFQFGNFELDCSRFELRQGGRSLRIERKPMELLILLAASEGRVVTRGEIAKRLWSSEVFVDTEHGINTAIRKLRHLLHDDPEIRDFIQTVTGMGYRFVAPVSAVAPIVATRPTEIIPEPARLFGGLLGEERWAGTQELWLAWRLRLAELRSIECIIVRRR